jgi:Uri superfamily endonuclease
MPLTTTSDPMTSRGTSQLLDSGVYALTLLISHDEAILVGSLGRLTFKKGCYVYVGSARVSLRSRVARHLAGSKRVRWHIDYLTVRRDVNPAALAAWRSMTECEVATMLKKTSDGSVAEFGSSDCRCGSHLIYFVNLTRGLEALSAAGPDVSLSLASATRGV